LLRRAWWTKHGRHTVDAIRAFVEALKRPKTRAPHALEHLWGAKEAVPAAIALLDRGWGRPKQTFEAVCGGAVTSANSSAIA
jgi:hypothetical protein